MLFWAINMFVIYKGIESIRILLNIKAPLLILLGLALLVWAYIRAHGFGPMLSQPSAFAPGQPKAGQFWLFFFRRAHRHDRVLGHAFPEHPRFFALSPSRKRARSLGQIMGLPTTMALYSFIGVAVTSATIVIYGTAIWDPVDVLTRFSNPVVLVIAMLSLCVATLATNLAANVVSPANDFPISGRGGINFRTGGLITGIIGILIQPWKLIADPSGYIFTWLVAYSSLLGAVGGILIVDYLILRRGELDLRRSLPKGRGHIGTKADSTQSRSSRLLIGIAPCVPGFLGVVHALHVAPIWMQIYNYAWFISFGISGVSYAVLMKALQSRD